MRAAGSGFWPAAFSSSSLVIGDEGVLVDRLKGIGSAQQKQAVLLQGVDDGADAEECDISVEVAGGLGEVGTVNGRRRHIANDLDTAAFVGGVVRIGREGDLDAVDHQPEELIDAPALLEKAIKHIFGDRLQAGAGRWSGR